MPRLVYKCPGRYPTEPKTSRRETKLWQRTAIVNSSRSSAEEAKIRQDLPPHADWVPITESGIRKLR